MAINNVQMDIGTFFGQFLGNILGKIQSVTAPLEPVLQVLNERLPVISDLLNKIGQPSVTLLTLAQTLGGVDTAPIQGLATIVSLVNSVPTDASGLEINFGSFDLSGTDVRTVSNLAGATPNPTGPAFQSVTDQLDNDSHSGDASFLSQLQTLPGGGFDFPILNNPTNVFGLFLGQNETLFDYELPDLSLHFQYSQFFPVIGPLGVNFTGAPRPIRTSVSVTTPRD